MKALHVVVGVIYNAQGKILLARRPLQVEQGGLWEFPGGKREKNETVKQALARELQEELGIVVEQARPFIRVHHVYPQKKVLLDVWIIEKWSGVARGCEGQVIQWCCLNQLREKSFPAANFPIITAVQLPSRYLITPEPLSHHDHGFFYRLEKCLAGAISLVQLRAKNLSPRAYCYCAEKALKLCERYQAKLLVNSTVEIANSVGSHGVHLTSQRLMALSQRPFNSDFWVAASCHNMQQIQQANRHKIDFLVLSPVKNTASHPTHLPLGWYNFFQLTELAYCPVFALGGMTMKELAVAYAHGAQGIAAIRAFWNN